MRITFFYLRYPNLFLEKSTIIGNVANISNLNGNHSKLLSPFTMFRKRTMYQVVFVWLSISNSSWFLHSRTRSQLMHYTITCHPLLRCSQTFCVTCVSTCKQQVAFRRSSVLVQFQILTATFIVDTLGPDFHQLPCPSN